MTRKRVERENDAGKQGSQPNPEEDQRPAPNQELHRQVQPRNEANRPHHRKQSHGRAE